MSTKKEAILQDKSNMLDEVNKLLDLMDMEKNSLHQKIAQLELQLESNPGCNSEKKEKIIQTESPYESSSIQCVSDMWTLLMKERVQLKEMNSRTEQISVYCNQERVTVQTELNEARDLLHQTQTNLRQQTRDTKMLESKLTSAIKVQNELKESNTNLSHLLEDTRTKYMKTRTSLLAAKGRRSLELKKTRKNEEEKEKRDAMAELEREQLARSRLQQQLQIKVNENDELRARLVIKDDEIDNLSAEYDGLKQGVEERLDHLGKQLTLSCGELERVKKSKQEQLNKCRSLLQQERKKSVELLSQSHCSVTQLTSQLEKERRDHDENMHSLTLKMAELKTQHVVEMDRVKDVTTKRCKELAQEIWILRGRDNLTHR